MADKPKAPKGTIRGHKITKAQQKLFGTARGMQEGGKSTRTPAGRIAATMSSAEVHKIASKPKGGYRKKK